MVLPQHFARVLYTSRLGSLFLFVAIWLYLLAYPLLLGFFSLIV